MLHYPAQELGIMGFGRLIRRLTTIQPVTTLSVGGNNSIFASPQALTFPMSVGLIGGAWGALQFLGTGWTKSEWIPFAMSLIIGATITFPAVWDEVQKQTEPVYRGYVWFRGSGVGLLNSLVLFGAVAGGKATLLPPS
jgi:hypothetical protein